MSASPDTGSFERGARQASLTSSSDESSGSSVSLPSPARSFDAKAADRIPLPVCTGKQALYDFSVRLIVRVLHHDSNPAAIMEAIVAYATELARASSTEYSRYLQTKINLLVALQCVAAGGVLPASHANLFVAVSTKRKKQEPCDEEAIRA